MEMEVMSSFSENSVPVGTVPGCTGDCPPSGLPPRDCPRGCHRPAVSAPSSSSSRTVANAVT